MKLFSLPPRRLSHFACNSPRAGLAAGRGWKMERHGAGSATPRTRRGSSGHSKWNIRRPHQA